MFVNLDGRRAPLNDDLFRPQPVALNHCFGNVLNLICSLLSLDLGHQYMTNSWCYGSKNLKKMED